MTLASRLRSVVGRMALASVPIRTRLLAAFVVILLLAGGLAFVGISMTARTVTLMESRLVIIKALTETRLRIGRIEHHVMHVTLEHEDWPRHIAELDQTDRAIDAAVAEHRRASHVLSNRHLQLVDDLETRYRALSEACHDVLRLLEAGRAQEARRRVLGSWQEIHEAALAAGDRLLAATNEDVIQAATAASTEAVRVRYLLVTLVLVGVGASVLLAVRIARSITRPLATLTAAAQGARQGELRPTGTGGRSDEIGQLGQSFDEMMITLERMLEQQREFLADVSHELKTPLTIISGEAEVALRSPEKTAAEYREALNVIAGSSAEMSRLVERLLFLAKSLSGQIPYEMKVVDLADVLTAAHRQSRLLAERKGVMLLARLGAEAHVHGDADRLRELLVILVDNAVKYTPPGGKVTIEFAADRRRAFVRVSDTGVGIPPESLPFIFRRFYRGGPQTTRPGDGAGVGLAIAKAIVDAHGGEIFVDSQMGKGSTFTVTLPRVDAVDAA
jgi:signal transduction histidine kinase